MKLTIIIPVYNEEKTVKEIVENVLSTPFDKEIIIIDDGSCDKTRDILNNYSTKSNITLIFQEKNKGKGAAVREGINRATGDIVLVQDADLEYDPREYSKLLKPIMENKAGVVYGSRFRGEGKAMLFWHAAGNKFLTFITNLLYDSTLTDMETCYKVFKRNIIQNVNLKSNRFNIEPEITAKILRQGHRIYEVPISYTGREYNEGKKITWKDGVVALGTLLYYRFIPRRAVSSPKDYGEKD